MARIAMTGLEAGSLAVFLSTESGAAISTTQARTGTYSLQIDKDDTATLALNGLYTELYGRICIYTTGNQGASGFLTLIDGGGVEHCNFARNPATGLVEFRRGTTVLATGSIVIPQNAWCCLEWHVVIDDSTGLVQTKVDGVADLDASGLDSRNGGEAGARLLRIGRTTSNATLLGYYDDIAVNDTSGGVNNSWTGRGGIYGLLPNGAGAHTDFTPSTGANYQCVDEVPPNTTDYVSSETAGHIDTYAFGDLPAGVSVQAVQWLAHACTSEAGPVSLRRLMRQAGTDYPGASAVPIDLSWVYAQEILNAAPSGAAWTKAIVDALEAGIEIV